MKVDSKCWNNFKGFIKDYFDEKLTENVHFKVNSLNEVILINKAAEDYETLFDMAYDSWTLALELQEL